MRHIPGRAARLLLPLSCLVVFCPLLSPNVQGQQPARKSSPTPGAPGGIGKAKLAKNPVEVLGGRLTVRMPQDARVEARPFHILAAPESEEHETRVVFDAGEERLVLMAHESFAFAGEDFEKDVKEWVARWKGTYKVEPLPLPVKGLKAVAVSPANAPDHSRSDDATFVAGIFVHGDDRTIQALDVYVNAAGEKDLKGAQALARRILRSVAPGKKKLQLAAGERRLSAFSQDWEIAVTVPKNVVATQQVGPDFLVHRLIVLGPLGADSGSVLIYVGGHPDYKPGAKQGEATMFGKRVEWHSFPQGEGLQMLCDLPIPDDPHLKAHIIIQAPDDSRRKELREAAESLKLVRSKGAPPK